MGGLLTLAFAAGMVAPVNPCGFALLPAWLTQTLGEGDASPTPVRLLRALRSGLALTVGFAGTLAAAGLLVSAGARGLIQAAPRLGLAVGIVLMLLGLWMLVGRSISLKLPQIPGRSTAGLPPTARMVVFGVGYALASLSCTFGVDPRGHRPGPGHRQLRRASAGVRGICRRLGSRPVASRAGHRRSRHGTHPPRGATGPLRSTDHRPCPAAHRRLSGLVLVSGRDQRRSRGGRPDRRADGTFRNRVKLGSGTDLTPHPTRRCGRRAGAGARHPAAKANARTAQG